MRRAAWKRKIDTALGVVLKGETVFDSEVHRSALTDSLGTSLRG